MNVNGGPMPRLLKPWIAALPPVRLKLLRAAMTYLGKKKSAKKRAACIRNLKLANAARRKAK
jgi:hypothetical protein